MDSIWVLYLFNDIWEMEEKCLDSESALHISGHVYHQQSNVTSERWGSFRSLTPTQSDFNNVERSSPFTPTDSSLSTLILSRLQEELSPLTQSHDFLCWPSSVTTAPIPPHLPLSDRCRCLADLLQTARGAEASNKCETTQTT